MVRYTKLTLPSRSATLPQGSGPVAGSCKTWRKTWYKTQCLTDCLTDAPLARPAEGKVAEARGIWRNASRSITPVHPASVLSCPTPYLHRSLHAAGASLTLTPSKPIRNRYP